MIRGFSSPSDAEPQVVLWTATWNERWPGAGLEQVVVKARAAEGVIVGVDEVDQPFRIEYRIAWDEQWITRDVDIEVRRPQHSTVIRLAANGQGGWFGQDAQLLPSLNGCHDVDLWPSPFTNTLAIRRLGLELGARREIEVAYISALDGEVLKARQAYTHSGPHRYQFESMDSDFVAELDVDSFGLVRKYPGLFTRVFPTHETAD